VGYLRRIYETALAEIEGSGYLATDIRWCLTVPAIWDDAEKQLMRRAAREAGLPGGRDRLLLAIEPEVAAVYCRDHLTRVADAAVGPRDGFAAPGTRFMVVDCGGGTVDITAYRVGGDDGKLTEIGRVSGGKLGSEYVNEEFVDQILADRFGGAQQVERLRRTAPSGFSALLERWEGAKAGVTVQRGASGARPQVGHAVYLDLPSEGSGPAAA